MHAQSHRLVVLLNVAAVLAGCDGQVPDRHTPEVDSARIGSSQPDHGVPPADAGAARDDSAAVAPDLQAPGLDSEPPRPPPDAGQPPAPDTGTPATSHCTLGPTVATPAPVSAPAWNGTGKTITVPAGGDIQAAIDGASPGDTISLADGTWVGKQLTIKKRIRLLAANPLGARLQGNAQPIEGSDNGITVSGASAAGTTIAGLEVSWYGGHSIGLESTGDVVVFGCKIASNGSQGIFLWDTKNVLLYGNVILDPYLAGQKPTLVDDSSNSNWLYNNGLVLMDYGVQAYGTVGTQVVQNYFHGEFNQTVSFKEGNRDYSVRYNTFEGSTGSAVLFGQNIAQYGPYSYSGQGKSQDTGTLRVEGNVFRPVVGLQGTQLAEYRLSGPIRMGHLNQATVYVTGNIIEGAIGGLSVEMGINSSAGGPSGNLYASHNIINGDLYDDGTMVSPAGTRHVGNWRGVWVHSGVAMNVFISHDTYVNKAYGIQNDGSAGKLTVDHTLFLKNSTPIYGATTSVTDSVFFPNPAASGSGNVSGDPHVQTTTVPLRKWSPDVLVPASDLTSRFCPSDSAPAKLADGTYAGAVVP